MDRPIPKQNIEVRGARAHNLQNIDLDLPLHSLVVITGVSGSGKSSLAFDTLYAEGQRRYIESFSTYARQFLDRLERPDADRIDHIPPAIAIGRKAAAHSQRSTVASATEIHDFLRLLYAKAGVVVCPDCNIPVLLDSPGSATERLRGLAPGTKYQICFPISAGMLPGDQQQLPTLQSLREEGFTRIISQGKSFSLNDITPAEGAPESAAIGDDALVVVDRLVVGSASAGRLADSLELAFRRGDGACVALIASGGPVLPGTIPYQVDGRDDQLLRLNSRLVCGSCGREFIAPEPRLFSFNSPLGACPACHGCGRVAANSSEKQAPDLSSGDGEPCPQCGGARLQPLALAVQVCGRNIAEMCRMTVGRMLSFLDEQSRAFAPHLQTLLKAVVPQISARLGYLHTVGLDYLGLDRAMTTLSSGEAQRIALTAALGSSLVNTLYVLDEPTSGLHPHDTERLLAAVLRLRDAGNSLVVVEHDPAIMRRADQLIDIGPGAGREGGRVVFQGAPADIEQCAGSLTGDYLAGRRRAGETSPQQQRTPQRRTPQPAWLRIEGARHNNLQNITLEIPLGVLCAVTGVSGSGKSSLIGDTLYPALCRKLGAASAGPTVGACDSISGGEQLDEVMLVDQSPIGRTPRSNPATYLHLFDEIRRLFAATGEAKVRNFKAGEFSFNTATGGRCPKCRGNGTLAIDMQFLPDVAMVCPDCRGTRFRREILEVKYRGLNVAEVLALTAREAFPFFRGESKLQRRLKLLKDVGLDYIALGQPADTISGGESQRLKLAAFMSGSRSHSVNHSIRNSRGGRTLFLLDEPTTGLHPADVARLIDCFGILLSAGHSIVVIEHNLDVMRCADYLIDLGPGAGAEGGRVVAQGTPEEVARDPESVTGRYLKEAFT